MHRTFLRLAKPFPGDESDRSPKTNVSFILFFV